MKKSSPKTNAPKVRKTTPKKLRVKTGARAGYQKIEWTWGP
jgi:hypothetical protein